jgi:hypothetical protein
LTDRANSDTPHPRRVRGLDTVADIKREAAALYRAGRKGDVAAGDASKLATILALVLRCTETADLEQRMAAIETKLAERAKS